MSDEHTSVDRILGSEGVLMTSTRLPTYFISHGGGPWPWLDGPFRRMFDRLEISLRDIAAATPSPRAVLVVSGHWVAPQFTVQSGQHPGMEYDYGGFPPHTYPIVYPAPGAPAGAARVVDRSVELCPNNRAGVP